MSHLTSDLLDSGACCTFSSLSTSSLATSPLLAASLSIFDPASPQAQSIVNLAVLVLAIIGLIFVIVEGVLLYSIWKFRVSSKTPADDTPAATSEPAQVYGSMPIEVAWTAAPALIVIFLILVSARTLWELEVTPPKATAGDNALYVTVIGHQWWWEYVYETYDGRVLKTITANELHIPASDDQTTRRTYLTLKSADVCHSYWVPRLGGKVDLIPGMANSLILQTKETGLFLGQCAEFCGVQHANMMLRVVVDTPEDFEKWLAHESEPAIEDPAVAEGKAAFLAESCINCHRVTGTAAKGTYAPDLTHLMSRETLASGMIKNTPQTLKDWIKDPQTIKQGCLMPAFKLDEKRLDLIVEYLLSLK